MRILDNISDRRLEDILILFTRREAEWIMHSFESLLRSDEQTHHHITDFDTGHEITIGLYDDHGENTYAPRVIRLIQEDQ